MFRFVPDYGAVSYLDQNVAENKLLCLLQYLFAIKDPEEFQQFWGMSEGIEKRIANFVQKAKDYRDLVTNIQTKRYPQNKIKRLLLHIINNTPKEYENRHHHYLRMLGSNPRGLEYIRRLPKNVKSKIITSFKNQEENPLVRAELAATQIYAVVAGRRN